MPAPLAAAAVPLMGKLALGAKLKGALAALKGAVGMGGSKQLALNLGQEAAKKGILENIKAAGVGAARQAASVGGPQGVSLGGIKRFAGNALNDYMGPGGVTPTNLAMNFGFDTGFGVLQGINTPGDLGDKLIAGTTSAVGGAMGGVGAVGMLGKYKNNPALRMMGEFGGGMIGDMGGQMVGDTVMRAKGGGMTPWERVQQEGDQDYRQQIERQILAQYGVGGYNQPDLFMQENGLG